MKPAVRDRLFLPILLPIAILIVIVAVLYGFSRILLSLTPTAATFTALVASIGIVAAASFAAARRHVRLSTLGAMVGVSAGVAMLAGGIALAVVAGEEEGEGGEERPVVTLAAANVEFEPTSLTAPAGEPFTLRFHNQDADVQHNVEIFEDPEFTGEPVFAGELITGVSEVDYPVSPLEAGPYAFRCVVHPDMTGELEAVEGEGGGGDGGEPGGPGEPGGLTVVAQNTEFDTSTIELPPAVAGVDHIREPGCRGPAQHRDLHRRLAVRGAVRRRDRHGSGDRRLRGAGDRPGLLLLPVHRPSDHERHGRRRRRGGRGSRGTDGALVSDHQG